MTGMLELLQKRRGGRTSELDLQLGIDELVALQDLPEAAPLVLGLLGAGGRAEGQVIVVVCLLRVVVLRAGRRWMGDAAGKPGERGAASELAQTVCRPSRMRM